MSDATPVAQGQGLGKVFYMHVVAEIVVIGAIVALFMHRNSATEQRIKALEETVAQMSAELRRVAELSALLNKPIANEALLRQSAVDQRIASDYGVDPRMYMGASHPRGRVTSMGDNSANIDPRIVSNYERRDARAQSASQPVHGEAMCPMQDVKCPVPSKGDGNVALMGTPSARATRRGAVVAHLMEPMATQAARDCVGFSPNVFAEMLMMPPLSMLSSVMNDACRQTQGGHPSNESRIEVVPDESAGSHPVGGAAPVDVPFDDTIEDSDSEIAEELEELKLCNNTK